MSDTFPQRVYDLLEHTVHAIDRISTYTNIDQNEFHASEMIQNTVLRNIEIVGEASRSIEKRLPEFAEVHPDMPLKSAYEMRTALSHG